MRAFVTGLDGFAGQWLARELLASGVDVAGGSRNASPTYSVLSAQEAKSVAWFPFELADGEAIARALRSWRADAVYHLAAQSSVADSHGDPRASIAVNVDGTRRVMEAICAEAPAAAVLYVGSAEEYGAADPADMPLRETAPLRPNNPYAASKAQGEAVALKFARERGIRAIATRSFNHIGPGQRTSFAVSAFARQLAEIKRGVAPPAIEVGNLEARRDFTDVRDVVRAYRLLVERGETGTTYNVCSGVATSLREILDMLVGIAEVDVEVRLDPKRLRPVDTPVSVGDNARLRAATGWSQQIPLERSLRDLFDWHQSRT